MGLEGIYLAYKDIVLKTEIYKLMDYEGSNIYIKRDDKIKYSYGGNSVRIAVEFFKDMYEQGSDAVISYGSRHSNINRVVSSLAKDAGISCRVVTPLDDDEYNYVMDLYLKQLYSGEEVFRKHRNEKLVDENGALRTYCKRSEVKNTIEDVMHQFKYIGKKCYYIYGDSSGSGYEKVALRAYDKAYDEIIEYENENDIQFDCIVCAYGIGITLEGLMLGRDRYKRDTLLCGLSISRPINEDNDEKRYYITDIYNGGGYEVRNDKIESIIEQMEVVHGIRLDPVYTGKAFDGMLNEIAKKRIKGNILFIHTGGYPVFEEWRMNKENIKSGRKR